MPLISKALAKIQTTAWERGWSWPGRIEQVWHSARRNPRAALLVGGLSAGVALLVLLITHWNPYKAQREAFAPLFTLVAGLAIAGVTLMRHFAQTEADRQRRITDTFSKAVEQLSSDKIEARLGGIYTLERLAGEALDGSRDADRNLYWTVMETLTAFVRERARWKEPDPRASETVMRFYEEASADRTAPATDIAAVLAVIRRRSEAGREREKEKSDWRFDLHGTDLRGADLYDAHLEGADLKGAHLEGAYLVGAHLKDAGLYGAHLAGADLYEAHLQGANFSGVHLEGTDLRKARLSTSGFGFGLDLDLYNFDEAHGDAWTRLPAGIERPERWPPEAPAPVEDEA